MQLIIKKKRSMILKLVRRAFKTPFALEEYQAGNRQGIVVFGKEAATGLHQDYEDWDCWWTDSMAWRWHFRGTTVTTDAIPFRTFRFTPIDDFLAFYQNLPSGRDFIPSIGFCSKFCPWYYWVLGRTLIPSMVTYCLVVKLGGLLSQKIYWEQVITNQSTINECTTCDNQPTVYQVWNEFSLIVIVNQQFRTNPMGIVG